MTAMDAKVRQKTLRMLSNGVYVLTSRSEHRYGAATVTWVSQASFRPPLIMAAVRRESNVFECLAESRSAVLHIVGDRQQEIARRFFFPTHTACGTINGEAFMERSEEHTSELQSHSDLVCRLLLEKKKTINTTKTPNSICD